MFLEDELDKRVTHLAGRRPLVVRADRLITGTGEPPIVDAALVIVDRRITFVGRAQDVPRLHGAEELVFPGKVLLPGLFEMHMHFQGWEVWDHYRMWLGPQQRLGVFRAAQFAAYWLAAGFTTVRDLGLWGPAVGLKAAIAHGVIAGPRMLTAVSAIAETGGHSDSQVFPYKWTRDSDFPFGLKVDGVASCRRAVRTVLRQDADVIKVFLDHAEYLWGGELISVPAFSDEELGILIEEAHRHGLRVAGHQESFAVMRQATELGIDTLEHLPCRTARDWPANEAEAEEVFHLMAAHGVVFVPTLTTIKLSAEDEEDYTVSQEMLPRAMDIARVAVRSGVEICCGTDLGETEWGLGQSAMELELLVEAGMTPMQVIESATRVAAKACGLEAQLGTLEVGKLADVIVVDGDPLKDIRVLYAPGNPVHVFTTAREVATA